MTAQTATLPLPASYASDITEPAILTANCYFWSPASVASCRRANESRRQGEVAAYLTELGLRVTRSGDDVTATGDGFTVHFHYSETCSNVYRRLQVTFDGRRSNVTALRKLARIVNAERAATRATFAAMQERRSA